MGGECSVYEGEERLIQDFGWETCGEDPGVDGRTILR